MENFKNLTSEEINSKMQELLNNSDAYCAIDNKGELQCDVDNNTAYIVDCNADEHQKYHKEKENQMMCIMDRNGENFYAVSINPWW